MFATRELAANSGKVMKSAKENGFVVVTKAGKPTSIIISTSEDSLISDVRSVINMKLKQIMGESQTRSLENGNSRMSMKDIDSEIAAARKLRKGRV